MTQVFPLEIIKTIPDEVAQQIRTSPVGSLFIEETFRTNGTFHDVEEYDLSQFPPKVSGRWSFRRVTVVVNGIDTACWQKIA